MKPFRFNKGVVGCVVLLVAMGLFSLWTQAPPTDLEGKSMTQSTFLKQLTFAGIGLALMGLVAWPPYLGYRHLAFAGYLVLLIALAALLLKNDAVRGARGWFRVGPFMLQPAEFMKIAYVLTLANVLMYGRDVQSWRGVALPLVLTAVPAALIVVQPDLGTTLLFVPTLLAMLFAAGARKRHLAIILAAMLAAAPVVWFKGMKPYQRDRILSCWFPEKAPPSTRFQMDQAIKAVSAGRLAGARNAEASLYYIPDRPTDFVYTIVAEELGFLGSTVMLLLFATFYGTSFRIAFSSREPFGRLIVVGLTTMLATQTFINLGMTLGVAPITGLTLPFVSYGGSSMLTSGVMAGLILNVAARWQPGFSSRDMAGGTVEIRGLRPQGASLLP